MIPGKRIAGDKPIQYPTLNEAVQRLTCRKDGAYIQIAPNLYQIVHDDGNWFVTRKVDGIVEAIPEVMNEKPERAPRVIDIDLNHIQKVLGQNVKRFSPEYSCLKKWRG